jgi:hypothetical protein
VYNLRIIAARVKWSPSQEKRWMFSRVFRRPFQFVALVAVLTCCHFLVFATCYFFYRRSYWVAPTALQSCCGFIARVLAYPLRIIGWIPTEPHKVLFGFASIANSLLYAALFAGLLVLLQRILKPER